MNSFLISSPARFKNYREYFVDFIERNHQRKAFSQRGFAKRVGWPVSYLNDLVKGRKHLTVSRAFQFARVLDLNPLHAEKLIDWVIQERSHLKDQVVLKKSTVKTARFEEEGMEFTPQLLSVFEVLQWKKGKITPLQIQKLLYIYDDLSVEKIKKHLKQLEEKKVIRLIKSGEYELLVKSFFWDDFGKLTAIQTEALYHENYSRWLKTPKGPARFSSGLIEVAEEDFPLVQERLDQLRNQLLALSRKTANQEEKSIATDLLQFGMTIFPIIDKTRA